MYFLVYKVAYFNGLVGTIKAFVCSNADSFAMVYLHYFLTNGSSYNAAVLHEINEEIAVLTNYLLLRH